MARSKWPVALPFASFALLLPHASAQDGNPPSSSGGSSSNLPTWIGVGVGVVVLVSCITFWCCCGYKFAQNLRRPPPPRQGPLPVPPAVRQAPPMAIAVPVQAAGVPMYNVAPIIVPSAPVYDYGFGREGGAYYHEQSYGNGINTIGALAAGMIVADVMMDHHGGGFVHHHGHEAFDGGHHGFGGGHHGH